MNTIKRPLISIIVPCYNQGRFVSQTLESIVRQTYTNWECIVVNDGSTDDSGKVIEEGIAGNDQFRYIVQENKGTSAAKNTALGIAKGDYIQILDADDILAPDKLNWQVNFINGLDIFRHDKIITYSSSRFFYNDDTDQRSTFRYSTSFQNQIEITFDDKDLQRLAFIRNPVQICTPLYPKAMFEEIGGYDETMHALEDWDLHLRAFTAGYHLQYTGYRKDAIVLVRIHDESATNKSAVFSKGYNQLFAKHHKDDVYGTWNSPGKQKAKQLIKGLIPPMLFEAIKKILKK